MSVEQRQPGEESELTPDCPATDSADYTPEPVTEALLAFHEPCRYPDCYPDSDPAPGDEVLRVRGGHANKVHRSPRQDGGDA